MIRHRQYFPYEASRREAEDVVLHEECCPEHKYKYKGYGKRVTGFTVIYTLDRRLEV